jgi:RHS repeat-associated protein
LADNSGNVVQTARFLSFGGYRTEPTADITDRGFTGHQENDYIKLIYMNSRWYDAAIGRFISADTIVPEAGDPQALNRYSYVRNNPMTHT